MTDLMRVRRMLDQAGIWYDVNQRPNLDDGTDEQVLESPQQSMTPQCRACLRVDLCMVFDTGSGRIKRVGE